MSETFVMLAHPYEAKKHLKKVEGWWISEKYDGVRGYWDGETMSSRKENEYTIPDFIKEQLDSIVDEENNKLELDGEFWFGYDTFALCSGTLRRKKVVPEEWKEMKYMIFDIPDTEMPFEDRIKKISKAIKNAGELPNIKLVKFKRLRSETTTIDLELKKVEDSGGEGLMLRCPGSMYERKRSHNMLKVKNWCFGESEVISYIKGKSGKYSDMVGSLLARDLKTKNVFAVGIGLSDWQRYSGITEKDWTKPKKEVQDLINKNRTDQIEDTDINLGSKEYKKLMEIIENGELIERQKALVLLGKTFERMPVIGDIITYKFKEKLASGSPSFTSFVTIRDYE